MSRGADDDAGDPVDPPRQGQRQGERQPQGQDQRRRRSRRVCAPPTNPEADQSDDVATGGGLGDVRSGADAADTPRDRWIKEQRPPHWG